MTEDEDFVYITLTDGSVIKLPKEGGSGDDESSLIMFADPLVKEICVEHFDANGDGEISMAEAAAVTNIPQGLFKESSITSFDELRYFTGVTTIPLDFCFYCRELTSIVLPENVTAIENCAFVETKITSINIPKGVTQMGNHIFDGCFNLTSIELPEGLTRLETCLFYRCGSLVSVNIPQNVTEIELGAFAGCGNLASIELPDNISVIREVCFQWCGNLTSIEIPDNVTEIEVSAFRDCGNLTSISLPDKLSVIKEGAFYGCGFTTFEFPAGVTSVGGIVLDQCENLTAVYSKAIDPPACAANSFTDCPAEILYVPVGSREKYLAAEGWKDFTVIEETSFE